MQETKSLRPSATPEPRPSPAATASAFSDEPWPSRFARYETTRRIGSGGMGVVYEATHTLLNKRVALKMLQHRFAADEAGRQRFMREAEIGARVRHAHIVEVYDAGIEHGIPFLVMDLLQGESLATCLSRQEFLGSQQTVNLVLPLVAALAEVHRCGLAHCDLKPENVFVCVDEQGDAMVKLLDFGISKELGPRETTPPQPETPSPAGARGAWPTIEGTPEYMAPEQLRGEPVVDARSDQYGLGVLLYQCLAGARPFASGELLDIVHRVCTGQCAPLAALRPDLPRGLVEVVTRAMAIEVEARFADMEALGRALLPFASIEVQAAYEREFLAPEQRRSSVPAQTRSWLPPPRLSIARYDVRVPPAPKGPRRIPAHLTAFACAALLTALAMSGTLLFHQTRAEADEMLAAVL